MKMFMADFETVVEENTKFQTHTEVWAWAVSQLFDNTENVTIGNDIDTFFDYMAKQGKHVLVYFINIKFDGSFILDDLFKNKFYKNGFDYESQKFKQSKDLQQNELIYTITDMGIWYSIIVRYKGSILEFRDGLKLLPFSVKALSKAFDTKYQKLEMDYKGHSKKGETITPEEEAYIRNDILVPKEAFEKFLTAMNWIKNPPLTIGQGAMREFKKTLSKAQFDEWFPNLAEIELDKDSFGSSNADEYLRKAYGGGWCYCRESTANQVLGSKKNYEDYRIKVYDVNSLYPSMMHSRSGNRMPIGTPVFFKGRDGFKAGKSVYYFIRFRCNFELKPGMLPFIQIKNNLNYRRNVNLFSSYYNRDGEFDETIRPELTMTETMFVMFRRCYKVTDFEILDGCYFETETGVFDGFIDKFFKMKQENDKNKVLRTCAKLMLNNLYGKFGTSPINAFKVAHVDDDIIELFDHKGDDKKPIYIPIAAAITSYARRFTVAGALANVDAFLYSDTDSIHLLLHKDEYAQEIRVHDTDLCAWKLESEWLNGIYLRQKTYIEYSDQDYDIKACGLSDRSKELLKHSFNGTKPDKMNEDEREFLSKKRTVKDFKQGLTIPSNLEPRTIDGGCVLVETCFTLR